VKENDGGEGVGGGCVGVCLGGGGGGGVVWGFWGCGGGGGLHTLSVCVRTHTHQRAHPHTYGLDQLRLLTRSVVTVED